MLNRRIAIAPAAAVVTALLLSSCASNPGHVAKRGKDSRDEEGLFTTKSEGNSRSALEISPDLLSSANARVLPEIIGASIRSDTQRAWLEVDADAEVVWRKLTEFWDLQEVELADSQPASGLMETDWFAKVGNNSRGGAGEFLKAFLARRTAADKFSLRLERNGGGGTKVFITHRRREKISNEPNNKAKSVDYQWVEREQDKEKVMGLLQTLVVLFDSSSGAASNGEPA